MTRALMSLALACLAGLPLVAAPKLRDKTRPLAEDIVGEWRVTQRSTENGPMEDGMTSWKIAEGKLPKRLDAVGDRGNHRRHHAGLLPLRPRRTADDLRPQGRRPAGRTDAAGQEVRRRGRPAMVIARAGHYHDG